MKISWEISDKDYSTLLSEIVTIPENNVRIETFLNLFPTLNKCSSLNSLTPPEILFLGGSITVGSTSQGTVEYCYPKLATTYIKDLLEVPNIQTHNLGYSSFNSILGLSVLERNKDVLHPNLAILEFAVNNGFDRDYATCFEGLVQKLLSCYPSIAIIIISTITELGYTCEPYMKEIASYYNLPHISVPTAIKRFPSYDLTWRDYSLDDVHPHKDGYIFLSDCIKYILETSLASGSTNISSTLQPSMTLTKTSPCFGNTFASIKYYDADKMPNFIMGSFQPAKTHSLFPNGIVHKKNSNITSILKVHCKKLYIIYEQSDQVIKQGQLHVTISPINQEYYIDSYSIYTWGNPVVFKIIDGYLKDYTISFKLLVQDIQKDFTILGFLLVD